MLEDGAIVAVVARPEPLVEIAAPDAAALARLAWHLGNRHTELQVVGDRLRMRRDRVLEDMLTGLGARVTPVEAPFEPERGWFTWMTHAVCGAPEAARASANSGCTVTGALSRNPRFTRTG